MPRGAAAVPKEDPDCGDPWQRRGSCRVGALFVPMTGASNDNDVCVRDMADPAPTTKLWNLEVPKLEDAFAPPEPMPGQKAKSDERRYANRVDLERPIRYRFPTIPAAATWSQGLVVNLSETGGAFLVDGAWDLVERIESEEWVPIDIEILIDQEGKQKLRLRAEIVWVQPDGGGEGGVDRVGASFAPATDRERRMLHDLLDDAMQPAAE